MFKPFVCLICRVECRDFEFFDKMEKNNADMDVTSKFNTYLEKAFVPFFEPFCVYSASKFEKSGLTLL
jgi:hypothetical protein